MIRKPLKLCTAGLVFAIAACDNSTGLSDLAITQADAGQLAADMDDNATLGASDFGLASMVAVSAGGSGSAAVSAAPETIDNQFTVTRQCPQGGQVVIAGRTTGSGDRATRSLSLRTLATRTDASCAFQTRDGVLTVNGKPNIAYDGQLNIEAGQLKGLQTQTHKGSFTASRPGGSITCDVDLSSSYDPDTRTAIVTGKFCGHTVNHSHTRG